MTKVHETSWHEAILRLRAGEPAPVGYEIKHIIGSVEQLTGPNSNTETVYIVACRAWAVTAEEAGDAA